MGGTWIPKSSPYSNLDGMREMFEVIEMEMKAYSPQVCTDLINRIQGQMQAAMDSSGLTITDEGVKEKPKRKLLAGGGGGPGGGDEHLQEGPTSVRTLAENEAASYPQCYIPFMSAEHGRQSCIEQMTDVSAEMQKSVAKSRYLDCL